MLKLFATICIAGRKQVIDVNRASAVSANRSNRNHVKHVQTNATVFMQNLTVLSTFGVKAQVWAVPVRQKPSSFLALCVSQEIVCKVGFSSYQLRRNVRGSLCHHVMSAE